jgi:hypothetical protein
MQKFFNPLAAKTYEIFHQFQNRIFRIKRASSPNYRGGLFLPLAELGFSFSCALVLGVFYGFGFYAYCLLSSEFCCLTSVFCIFFVRLKRPRRFSAQKGRINQIELKYAKRTQFQKRRN